MPETLVLHPTSQYPTAVEVYLVCLRWPIRPNDCLISFVVWRWNFSPLFGCATINSCPASGKHNTWLHAGELECMLICNWLKGRLIHLIPVVPPFTFYIGDSCSHVDYKGKQVEDDDLQFVPLTIRKDCTHLGVTASKIQNVKIGFQRCWPVDEKVVVNYVLK